MTDIGRTLIKWHHELAQITGSMSIAIGRRKIRRSDMLHWASIAQRVAGELAATANNTIPPDEGMGANNRPGTSKPEAIEASGEPKTRTKRTRKSK